MLNHTMLIKRVLQSLSSSPPPPIICVFVGSLDEIPIFTHQLTHSLPPHFTTTIDIQSIENSTLYLQASRNCTIFYTRSCFKVITTEEFINTHYEWLYKQVNKWYDKTPDSIRRVFSVDDAFQEVTVFLDRILSKFDNQCNLRTFVANRLRRYFDLILRQELIRRRDEIKFTLDIGTHLTS